MTDEIYSRNDWMKIEEINFNSFFVENAKSSALSVKEGFVDLLKLTLKLFFVLCVADAKISQRWDLKSWSILILKKTSNL